MQDLGKLPEKIRVLEQLSCERLKPYDIWDRLWVYVVLIGVLGAEWLTRRASALV
jgi:hypothetical protein